MHAKLPVVVYIHFFSTQVHYTTRNRYYADGTLPDNTLAQIAINITLFHWGKHITDLKSISVNI